MIRFGWGGRRGGVVGERRGRVIYFNLNWSGKLKRKGSISFFWKSFGNSHSWVLIPSKLGRKKNLFL